MTYPVEDDSPENECSDDNPTSTDPSEGNDPNESSAGDDHVSESLATAVEPVTDKEWDRLRAPFSRTAYVVNARAAGRTESNLPVGKDVQEKASQTTTSNRVVADLRLRTEAIRSRLDLVLGPQRYSFRLEAAPNESAERAVFCHLRIGTASRTGIGTGSSYQPARKLALANAALDFGIGTTGQAAGPIIVGRESRYDVPPSILEALETRDKPSLWAPEESS